jgi:hypothetical protein
MPRTGWRAWAVFLLKALAVLLVVVVVAASATIGVARALLPKTCDVTEAQFDKLAMEMRYDEVKGLLGCDGVLERKEDYGQIVIEHYAWRGAVWPYGRLRGEFINNTLQGTEKLWLNLAVTLPGSSQGQGQVSGDGSVQK